jgi:hypothetical protein
LGDQVPLNLLFDDHFQRHPFILRSAETVGLVSDGRRHNGVEQCEARSSSTHFSRCLDGAFLQQRDISDL